MSQLLTSEKLAELLPKLIPGMLGLYKKYAGEALPITQGISLVLHACVQNGSLILQPHLDLLIQHFYPLVQYEPNFADPPSVKNHNEVLRCFEHLSQVFSQQILSFLFLKLEIKDEKIRIGTLQILKHLINSCGKPLEDKRRTIVSALRPLLIDSSTRLKRTLAQVIIAMAHHEFLSLEGGDALVKFIVQQCAVPDSALVVVRDPKKKVDDDEFTVANLKSMCENILQLMTTTVTSMGPVLYPFLLELFVPAEFTDAVGVISKTLSQIGNKLLEEDSDHYDIDYEVQVNLPKPHEFIARAFVLLGHPLIRNRGLSILALMKVMSGNLKDEIVDLWEDVIPKLSAYIEANENDWKQTAWEDLVLKLLSKTLDVVNSEQWVIDLGTKFGSHLPMYARLSDSKSMLYKCLGVIMRKSTKKDFINTHLELIYKSVDHSIQIEREGCARAYGYCASSHIDSVIERLAEISRTDLVRKSTGFLGMSKDKTEAEVARIKATVMLSYGYVALYSPPDLITSRIEVNILATINPQFGNVRETIVKENLIRCVDLIGKALHPSHLKSEKPFELSRRADLINHMQNFILAEPKNAINNDIRSLATDACTTLVMLDPKLSDADLFKLVEVITQSFFDIPAIAPPAVAQTQADAKDKGEKSADKTEKSEKAEKAEKQKEAEKQAKDATPAPPTAAQLEAEEFINKVIKSFKDLLSIVIEKDTSSTCLQNLQNQLSKWMTAAKDNQRLWMLSIYEHMLQQYFTQLSAKFTADKPATKLENIGKFLADLVPRCTDPVHQVRTLALTSIRTLLKIQSVYQHADIETDVVIEAMGQLITRAENTEANAQFTLVNDLSKIMSKKVAPEDLLVFINAVAETLTDAQPSSSSGSCVMLNGIFRQRGTELEAEVANLITTVHDKLAQISHERTGLGVLRCVRTLATHHLALVTKQLQTYELPYDQNVVNMWRALALDESNSSRILTILLEILNTGRPYEEEDKKDSKGNIGRTATVPQMKATCAIRELFAVEEALNLAKTNFPAVMCTLFTRIASCVGVKAKETALSPVKDAIDAFQEFAKRTSCDFIFEALDEDDKWQKLQSPDTYVEVLTLLSKTIVVGAADQIPALVQQFDPVIKRVYVLQRIAAACFFAEVINNQCGGHLNLLNALKNGLLTKIVDQSHVVRMLCIRGLGNIASVPEEHMKKHTTTVLSAMVTGMDDRDDPNDDITLEAMNGLSKILAQVEEDNVRAILLNISLRIRPCFEKAKPQVRASSIRLFGNLSRFGDGPSKEPFGEQIHANFMSLLLHLNEEDLEVRKACKVTLKQLGPLLESEPTNAMFQKHLVEDASLHYGEFMNDLSKVMIQDLKDKVNFYVMSGLDFLKSEKTDLRANAAIFTGFLLGNLQGEARKYITKDHVCGEMIRLLKDPQILVRCKASEALSLLFEY